METHDGIDADDGNGVRVEDAALQAQGYRQITSRLEFRSAVIDVISRAADNGCREMLWCDSNFAHWPLDDPKLLAALTRYGLPQRKLVMLATEYDRMTLQFPAFVRWRRLWSHVVECREPSEAASAAMPTWLFAAGVASLRLADPVRFQGIETSRRSDMRQARESIDALLQRSQPAFPATVLGL